MKKAQIDDSRSNLQFVKSEWTDEETWLQARCRQHTPIM